jgi:hypothetical protein
MGLSSFASKPVEQVVAANPRTFVQAYRAGTRDEIAVADAHPAGAHPFTRGQYVAKLVGHSGTGQSSAVATGVLGATTESDLSLEGTGDGNLPARSHPA